MNANEHVKWHHYNGNVEARVTYPINKPPKELIIDGTTYIKQPKDLIQELEFSLALAT